MVIRTSRGNWRRPVMGEHDVKLGVLLFTLLGPPIVWSLHFGVIYLIVVLHCTAGRTDVEMEVVLATAVAAAVTAAAGVVGYRKWREVRTGQGWTEAVTGSVSRSGFLLVMGIIGAALFTVLIVLEALPPFLVPSCSDVTL